MAVVKANAYGHGAIAIANALSSLVDALAVASLEEGVELRDAGIKLPILLLQGVFEAQDLHIAAQHDLWVTIASIAQLEALERTALITPVHCWLKINTGMNRLGVNCEEAAAVFARLTRCNNVSPNTVIYTHFACADNVSNQATDAQIKAFDAVAIDAPRSAANSAGVIGWPLSHYEWIRPGYMLYGNSPLQTPSFECEKLRPVMTLQSKVSAIRHCGTGDAVGYGGTWVAQRPSLIATVSIGYGDGYPRGARNGTPVLINGHRAALVGRVSMDMLTIDVTDISGVAVGSEVVLWGDSLPLSEIAEHADTIGYELTTRMPARIPRILART